MISKDRSILGIMALLGVSLILTTPAHAETFQIGILNGSAAKECFSCYQPVSLKISKGDTVSWENKDTTFHTITSKNSKGAQGNFDSGYIKSGELFSFTFRNIGEFSYGCSIHPWMKGDLYVVAMQTYPDFTWSDETLFYDTNNITTEQAIIGKKVSIIKEVSNIGTKDSGMALFMMQIKQNNVLIHEETVKAAIEAGKTSKLTFSWIPNKIGTYQVIFNADYGKMTGEINISNNLAFSTITVSDQIKIPTWVKDNAKWWNQGTIDNKEFSKGIQFMINEKIINISLDSVPSDTKKIPEWVKNMAKWWSEGKISDRDFVAGIKHLLEKRIITI